MLSHRTSFHKSDSTGGWEVSIAQVVHAMAAYIGTLMELGHVYF